MLQVDDHSPENIADMGSAVSFSTGISIQFVCYTMLFQLQSWGQSWKIKHPAVFYMCWSSSVVLSRRLARIELLQSSQVITSFEDKTCSDLWAGKSVKLHKSAKLLQPLQIMKTCRFGLCNIIHAVLWKYESSIMQRSRTADSGGTFLECKTSLLWNLYAAACHQQRYLGWPFGDEQHGWRC